MAYDYTAGVSGAIPGFLDYFDQRAKGQYAKSAATGYTNTMGAAISRMPWEPKVYASDTAPVFQRSQSPIARGYLDSMVLGTNPGQIRSTDPGAADKRWQLQQQENLFFGTPEERVRKEQEYKTQTPWAPKPITEPLIGPEEKETEWAALKPKMAKLMDKATYDKLVADGLLSPTQSSINDFAPGKFNITTDRIRNAIAKAVERNDTKALKAIFAGVDSGRGSTAARRRGGRNYREILRNVEAG